MAADGGDGPRRAAVRTAHDVRTPLTVDRAATLAARAFDDAMHALGMCNTTVAEYIGVSEGVVREMRLGKKLISAGRIVQLPPSLRVEFLRRLACADAPCGAREPQVCAAIEAAGRLIAAGARVMADGHVTEREVRDELAPEVARLDRVLAPLRASMEGP
jgi:hypothetical protein